MDILSPISIVFQWLQHNIHWCLCFSSAFYHCGYFILLLYKTFFPTTSQSKTKTLYNSKHNYCRLSFLYIGLNWNQFIDFFLVLSNISKMFWNNFTWYSDISSMSFLSALKAIFMVDGWTDLSPSFLKRNFHTKIQENKFLSPFSLILVWNLYSKQISFYTTQVIFYSFYH